MHPNKHSHPPFPLLRTKQCHVAGLVQNSDSGNRRANTEPGKLSLAFPPLSLFRTPLFLAVSARKPRIY